MKASRAGATAASVLLVVAAACTGCATRVDAGSAPAAAPTAPGHPTASRGPAVSLPAPGAVDVDPLNPLTGPVEVLVDVAYPYDLLTHCGVRWARFDGREWTAAPPGPEPGPAPAGPDGVITYNGYTRGTMTLLAPDHARFVIDHPADTDVEDSFDFVPATVATPPCA